MTFEIEIRIGETIEEVQMRWAQLLKDAENGNCPEANYGLSFRDWDHFLSFFTPAGRAMVEDFKRIDEVGSDCITSESCNANSYPENDGLPHSSN